MYNLYNWLADKISSYDTTLIDIGAYHGDFTQHLLSTKKFARARLFEPNAEHFAYLKNKFSDKNHVFLSPYALGSSIGSQTFHCSQDDATGSLLQYHPKYHHETAGKTVNSFSVDVTTLDDFYRKHFPDDKIGLIKIDTQGFDLEVLKGAEKLIRQHKPWLVIELNFLPFYAGQAPLNALFNWLTECGYHLGGLFNDHYSKDQWLAFADGVFIPEGHVDKVMEPFYPKTFNQELLEQNKYLQTVCEERLALINQLHTEAENRLHIINTLKNIKKPNWFKKLLSRNV